MSRDLATCPYPRCGSFISPDEFACRYHWRGLSETTRTEITAATALKNADWLEAATDNAMREWGARC